MKKFMHFLCDSNNQARISPQTNGTMSSRYPLETVEQLKVVRNEDELTQEYSYMKSNRHYPVSKPRAVTRFYDMGDNVDDETVEFDVENNKNGVRGYDLVETSYGLESLNPILVKKFQNLDAYPYVFETDYDVLCWTAAIISESPTGLALLNIAREAGWELSLSDLNTGGFHLDIDTKTIILDHFGFDASAIGQSTYYRLSLIPILAKALRDIVHEDKYGAFEETYTPESTLQLERVRAADTDSISVLVGWELRAAGYDDVWRHILSSDDGDMAQVMVNILERYPTAQYNGMAVAHVFRQWYADTNRIDAVDHDTLERLDILLNQKSGQMGEKQISEQDILDISILPDGAVYLTDLADTVFKDPFFSGLNDAINQAHLFQIIYDNKVTLVNDIPFRDAALAKKFFSV